MAKNQISMYLKVHKFIKTDFTTYLGKELVKTSSGTIQLVSNVQ